MGGISLGDPSGGIGRSLGDGFNASQVLQITTGASSNNLVSSGRFSASRVLGRLMETGNICLPL